MKAHVLYYNIFIDLSVKDWVQVMQIHLLFFAPIFSSEEAYAKSIEGESQTWIKNPIF